MKVNHIRFLLLAVFLLTLTACLAGKAVKGTDQEAVLNYAEPIADHILNGIEAKDYALFSQDFTDTMKKGIDALEKANRVPSTAQLWSYMGVAYARKNEIDPAIAANLKVTELQPGNAAALRNLVLLYQQKGDMVNAATYVDQAINSVSPAAGQVYTDMVGLGVQIYQQVATAEPTNYLPVFNMARLLQQLGQTAQARALAQQALQLAGDADKPTVQQLLQTLGG